MKRKHVMTLFAAAILVPVLSGPAKTETVFDFYKSLGAEKKILDVVGKKDGKWKFIPSEGEEGIEGQGEPVVDLKNGYIAYRYSQGACKVGAEIAQFIGSGKRNFIAVSFDYDCIEGTNYEFKMYEIRQGGKSVDVTAGIMSASYRDFFDENIFKKNDAVRKVIEELSVYFRIRYKLPRVGTAVIAELTSVPEGQVGDDQNKLKEAKECLDKYKRCSKIEFGWNMNKAILEMKKKIR